MNAALVTMDRQPDLARCLCTLGNACYDIDAVCCVLIDTSKVQSPFCETVAFESIKPLMAREVRCIVSQRIFDYHHVEQPRIAHCCAVVPHIDRRDSAEIHCLKDIVLQMSLFLALLDPTAFIGRVTRRSY